MNTDERKLVIKALFEQWDRNEKRGEIRKVILGRKEFLALKEEIEELEGAFISEQVKAPKKVRVKKVKEINSAENYATTVD